MTILRVQGLMQAIGCLWWRLGHAHSQQPLSFILFWAIPRSGQGNYWLDTLGLFFVVFRGYHVVSNLDLWHTNCVFSSMTLENHVVPEIKHRVLEYKCTLQSVELSPQPYWDDETIIIQNLILTKVQETKIFPLLGGQDLLSQIYSSCTRAYSWFYNQEIFAGVRDQTRVSCMQHLYYLWPTIPLISHSYKNWTHLKILHVFPWVALKNVIRFLYLIVPYGRKKQKTKA